MTKAQRTVRRFTTEHFIKWLHTLPETAEFDYIDPKHCAVAQYLKAQGHPKASVGPDEFRCSTRRGTIRYEIPRPIRVSISAVLRATDGALPVKQLLDSLEGSCECGGE